MTNETFALQSTYRVNLNPNLRQKKKTNARIAFEFVFKFKTANFKFRLGELQRAEDIIVGMWHDVAIDFT